MCELEFDVCVVGAGPAGAIAALRLATLGHRVCLVERQVFPRPHVGESLSPGIWPLLDTLGLRGVIARAPFRAPGETLLCWAESKPQCIPPGPKGGGLLVDRAEFDTLLLRGAQLAGVRIIQPAQAQVARTPKGWQVKAGSASFLAEFLIDASGRKGCQLMRGVAFSPPTLALWAHFEAENDPATRLEATPEGWLWAAPLAEGRFSLMFICNPAYIRRKAGGDLERLLRERLAETVLFPRFAKAAFLHRIVARDATCAFASEPIGSDYVSVGEVSYSLDPLSSTGVEKALQSALIGAIVAHTLLHRPERARLCARFYKARQQEAVATHAAWTNQYYRDVERYADKPFWTARCGIPISSPIVRVSNPPVAPRKTMPVRLAPGVSVTEEPCIVGDEIDTRPGLHAPSLARPVVFLDGIEVGTLLVEVTPHRSLKDLVAQWSQRMPPPRAERIAAWLWEKRILCEALPLGR
jgi:flavin-dependent dehydrogenase